MNTQLLDPAPQGASLTIKRADQSDRQRWNAYVSAHEGSTFFHRHEWAEVIETAYGHEAIFLIAENADGTIAGILPLIHVKSPLFGKSLISTAFTVGGGVLAGHDGAALALMAEAERIGRERGVDYVELRGGPGAEGWPEKTDTYSGFVGDIPADAEDNLKSIPRKKRADVRKAIKAADTGRLIVARERDIDAFYALYAESVRNLGTPVLPKRLIATMLKMFGQDMDIAVVRADGASVAALVSFWHGDTVLPYYGGASPAARGLHAYDFMYWSQMRHAADRGVTKFDFGRSKTGTGAYDYKRYWGFEPLPLTYHYRLIGADSVPDVNPNNPKFRMLTKIWQKLPLPVANMVGPHVARQLG